MKQKHFWAIVLLLGWLAICGAPAYGDLLDHPKYNLPPTKVSTAIPLQDIQRFATVIAQIKRYYIEPVDDKTLFNNAIRGLLSNLDPHSAYLDANDMNDLRTVTTGEFGGIGVEVIPEDGFIKVIAPLDDTPAYKAGIKAGDLIIRIDNKLIKDMTASQAIDLIRGKKGTSVTLTLVRKGASKPITVKLVREIIKVQAVKSRMLEPSYGYVRIAVFQAPTKHDMVNAINQLLQQSNGHLNGLILDLRNNPGGLLDSAVEIADTFLDASKLKDNELIVYTKGRIPSADIQAKATPGAILANTPLVVLINQGSASASEIVAGALQDHRRAIVLGTKSFGKGSVQTVIPIDNDSGIKLTTALYYTPKGRSIQATGIMPDVVVADLKIPKSKTQAILLDPIQEADLQGHLMNGSGTDKKDGKNTGNTEKAISTTLSPEQQEQQDRKTELNLASDDYQLYEALNLLKGLHAVQR